MIEQLTVFTENNKGSSMWIGLDIRGPEFQIWETQNEDHSEVANISQFQWLVLEIFPWCLCAEEISNNSIIAQIDQTV